MCHVVYANWRFSRFIWTSGFKGECGGQGVARHILRQCQRCSCYRRLLVISNSDCDKRFAPRALVIGHVTRMALHGCCAVGSIDNVGVLDVTNTVELPLVTMHYVTERCAEPLGKERHPGGSNSSKQRCGGSRWQQPATLHLFEIGARDTQ